MDTNAAPIEKAILNVNALLRGTQALKDKSCSHLAPRPPRGTLERTVQRRVSDQVAIATCASGGILVR